MRYELQKMSVFDTLFYRTQRGKNIITSNTDE